MLEECADCQDGAKVFGRCDGLNQGRDDMDGDIEFTGPVAEKAFFAGSEMALIERPEPAQKVENMDLPAAAFGTRDDVENLMHGSGKRGPPVRRWPQSA